VSRRQRIPWGVGAALASVMLALASGLVPVAAQQAPADARWFITTYANRVLVWDEATEQVVDTIPTKNRIPIGGTLNERKDRLYTLDASLERIETVDLTRGESVDDFTLSDDTLMVRINDFMVDPQDRYAVLHVKRYVRHRDRYEVQGPFLLRYDLAAKRVTDTIPWPDGQELEGVGLRFSPDGKLFYLFADDVIALDPTTWKEVDRWKLSRPLEPGLGRVGVGLFPGTYDAPGTVTSLFRTTDPAQNRRMMGIATVRLAEKQIDFYTLGPAEPVGRFALAPGGKKGYALLSQVGRYEFWEFDLEQHRVVRQVPFAGRPRMGLRVSHDGSKLYVFVAGNTIDVYDAATFEHLHTVTFDEDMTGAEIVPTGVGPGS
jgi:DNA-binding beta-propeller fold protein YncE